MIKKRILISLILFAFITLVCAVKITEYRRDPQKYLEYALSSGKENGISCELVLAVMYTESTFNEKAVSPKGAIGLMQIMPSTASFIAKKEEINGKINLYDGKTNIRIGCSYLKYLFDVFKDEEIVLCAYNAGEGNVRKWLKDQQFSKDGKMLYNIPFKETKEYVRKVEKMKIYYKKYLKNKALYAKEN